MAESQTLKMDQEFVRELNAVMRTLVPQAFETKALRRLTSVSGMEDSAAKRLQVQLLQDELGVHNLSIEQIAEKLSPESRRRLEESHTQVSRLLGDNISGQTGQTLTGSSPLPASPQTLWGWLWSLTDRQVDEAIALGPDECDRLADTYANIGLVLVLLDIVAVGVAVLVVAAAIFVPNPLTTVIALLLCTIAVLLIFLTIESFILSHRLAEAAAEARAKGKEVAAVLRVRADRITLAADGGSWSFDVSSLVQMVHEDRQFVRRLEETLYYFASPAFDPDLYDQVMDALNIPDEATRVQRLLEVRAGLREFGITSKEISDQLPDMRERLEYGVTQVRQMAHEGYFQLSDDQERISISRPMAADFLSSFDNVVAPLEKETSLVIGISLMLFDITVDSVAFIGTAMSCFSFAQRGALLGIVLNAQEAGAFLVGAQMAISSSQAAAHGENLGAHFQWQRGGNPTLKATDGKWLFAASPLLPSA